MRFYNEIIGLHESFSPYYRLNDEREGYWKEFIPTHQFYELLEMVIDSVDSPTIANRKSFWVHGTYGTGKSHATGVIKKLLYSPIEEIESYIDRFQNRNDLKHRLLNFRKNNKVFPVVMYGSSNITNNWDLVLEIEKAIRSALELNNVDISVKTEFDVYVEKISSDKSINWEHIIETTPELVELVNDTADLIKKLKAQDKDVLLVLRNELSKRHISLRVKDITSWIVDLQQSLTKLGIANKIILYWDEFTSIMDSGHSGIINQIQKLAEMAEDHDFYLYLISHRTQRQGMSKDDIAHIFDRFLDLNYQMSDITTYHLIASYIKKKDDETWKLLRDHKNDSIEKLISRISEFEDAEVKENVRDLFPIHPFTAYISSLIAREIGSTERSIFKFLNNDEAGFQFFINNQPLNGRIFLTAEYVFDFFLKDFEEEGNPFTLTVLNRFKYEENQINNQNPVYLSLFKGILLLNISHRILNVGTDHNDLVIPNAENLELMFLGSSIVNEIEGFLSFIHEKKIINRDHQNRYIVETSSLDPTEVNTAKRNIEKNYDKIETIINSSEQDRLFIYWKSSHRRKDITEILLMDCDSESHNIYRRIGKYKNNYSLKIIAFIARDHSVRTRIEETIKSLDGDNAINVIFVVFDTIFTSEEYGEFIEQRAKAEVAHKRNFTEEESNYLKNAEKVIENWISNVNDYGYIKWYLRDDGNELFSEGARFKDFNIDLNNKITKIIYKDSFDTYSSQMSTLTAWQEVLARRTGEIFLTASNLTELISLCRGPADVAQWIVKDPNGTYIVNEKLKIQNGDQSLPLNKMIAKLDNRIRSGEEINLADAFAFLFNPPFGFYKCHVFLATVGFLLRKYREKLYNITTGEIVSDNILKNMIEQIFQYHCDNSQNVKKALYVRLGSKDEKNLVQLVQEIFGLSDCQSLIDTRHQLHEWVKTNLGFPLWLYNYSGIDSDELLISIRTINDKILDSSADHHSLSTTEIKIIFDETLPYQYELNKVLQATDQKSKKEYFVSFFKNIDNIQIGESDYNEIMLFLDSNLQEDQVFWNEDKIRNIIKNWYIKKLEKPTPTEEEGADSGVNISVPPIIVVDEDELNEDKKRIIQKIHIFKGDFVKVLSELLNHRPDIRYTLEKLLDSEGK